MNAKLLAGVSALALSFAASGALANPDNTLANNNTTTVNSAAVAVVGGGGAGGGNSLLGIGNDNNDGGGTGGGDAYAYSESFNSSKDAVSIQTLAASTVGLDVSLLEIPILSGNATMAGNAAQNAAGVVQASVNTGMSAVNQQGSSIAAVGTVNIN